MCRSSRVPREKYSENSRRMRKMHVVIRDRRKQVKIQGIFLGHAHISRLRQKKTLTAVHGWLRSKNNKNIQTKRLYLEFFLIVQKRKIVLFRIIEKWMKTVEENWLMFDVFLYSQNIDWKITNIFERLCLRTIFSRRTSYSDRLTPG